MTDVLDRPVVTPLVIPDADPSVVPEQEQITPPVPAPKPQDKKTLVRVRRKHITAGSRRSTNRCPIALALMELDHDINGRSTGKFEVGSLTATYYSNRSGRVVEWKLPPEAVAFIHAFDSDMTPLPFEFTLEKGRRSKY